MPEHKYFSGFGQHGNVSSHSHTSTYTNYINIYHLSAIIRKSRIKYIQTTYSNSNLLCPRRRKSYAIFVKQRRKMSNGNSFLRHLDHQKPQEIQSAKKCMRKIQNDMTRATLRLRIGRVWRE